MVSAQSVEMRSADRPASIFSRWLDRAIFLALRRKFFVSGPTRLPALVSRAPLHELLHSFISRNQICRQTMVQS